MKNAIQYEEQVELLLQENDQKVDYGPGNTAPVCALPAATAPSCDMFEGGLGI